MTTTTKQDTGSTEYQIKILSQSINKIKLHLQTAKKDKHSLRGLQQKVSDRRKLYAYALKRNLDIKVN